MDAATARLHIERSTAWNSSPKLTVAEVEDLVLLARRPDEDGREPGDSGWIPTYDVRAGAALGWEWKLAKAVGNYDFSADGVSASKSQIVTNIEKMIARYRGGSNKTLQSVVVGTREPDLLPYPEQIA